MKTSIETIKKMAQLGILESETVKDAKFDDIVYTNEMGIEKKVLLDNITDEDLPILIQLKQYETVKSIKSMVTFFFISSLVGIAIGIGAILF